MPSAWSEIDWLNYGRDQRREVANTIRASLAALDAAEQRLVAVEQEIVDARENLPASRRQHLLDAPLIDIVRETVSHVCIVESQREQLRERLVALEQERDALHAIVPKLRKALAYYADPDDGWAEVEHADVYEESRALVPDDDEERSDEML